MSKDRVENLKKCIFFFFPKDIYVDIKLRRGKKKRVFSVITEKKLFKKR